jgi:rod shape-determining protein MreC
MESVLSRYRNLIILVGVLFLQVLGLAMQVKRSTEMQEKDATLIRIWAVGALSPFERGLVWVRNSTGNVWHNYFYLRGVRAENRELKQEIEQMRLEQVRLNEDAAQARRLQNLLGFKEQFVAKTVAAQVIGSSGSDFSRVITIDKGESSGIRRDMAVITADGIVGKVLFVYPSLSQVLLISDQTSGVGAILEKTRLQGVLRGTADGEVSLERVMSDEDVTVGEKVLTSGGDQIFPKGLPVGTVSKVGKGKDLFLNVRIKPAANLSKLEEVLVLVEKQERQAVADEKVRVRAADILAQRLPSVPEKPAETAPGAAVKNSGSNASGATSGTTGGAMKPKPVSPTAGTAAQTAKNAAGIAVPVPGGQPRSAKPVQPVTTRPKAQTPVDNAAVPKTETSKPAITEEKPATPANPPSIQPAPQTQPDPNTPN